MKLLKLLAAVAIAAVIVPMAAEAQASTDQVISRADGLHVGRKTTDKIGFHDATPVVQDANTVTAKKSLMNHGLMAGTTDDSTQHVRVTLTAANINGMYAAPVQLIAAPASGKAIVVKKLVFTITRTATAFANGGAAIVQYGNTTHGGGTQALDSTLASTVITGAAGTTISFRNGAVISDSTAPLAAGLFVSNATGAFDTGTGTALVDIWYVIEGGA